MFFDEFDAVGKERGDIHETGEIKRVVSSLLLHMDDVPSWTIIAAATNHAELLDRAAWRRFQLRLELPAPSERQIAAFIELFFEARRPLGDLGRTAAQLARVLRGTSLAEVEDFCTNILRQVVLAMGEGMTSRIVEKELSVWRSRVSPASQKKSAKSGRTTPTENSEPNP